MLDSFYDNVLLGVLTKKNVKAHLDWVLETNSYYMPLLKSQPKQFSASWLLIYVPKSIISPGAIRYRGLIDSMEVIRRDGIHTPWDSNQGKSKWQILYELVSLKELLPPIFNRDLEGNEQRISQPRWTTKIAMDRACTVNELLLESESDWWIYDNLKKLGIEFIIKARSSSVTRNQEAESRVWFILHNQGIQIRYAGKSGFIMLNKYGVKKAFMYIENLIENCLLENHEETIKRKADSCAAGLH